MELKTKDFDYELPPELIAAYPAKQRDASRLMVVERAGSGVDHRGFGDLPDLLRTGDCLVVNDSRVIPARPAVSENWIAYFKVKDVAL